jgi:hypothetical protein
VQFDGLMALNSKITVLWNIYRIVCQIGANVSDDSTSSASLLKMDTTGFTISLVELCVFIPQEIIIKGLPLASMC